ncbi:AMP-binding protein [Nocardioides hwasunensis]|uniref:AMP-binding protein n=1 Tax=Nocardioides hwasunensis TaxID=397258 RepID=A0ABR8MBK1_9ACTN|nr:AMP-binding protein [Nocardioides hwasunensis]MBD3913307.1 AMP-binding protein [Nocardioides hwasunensis]
MTDIAWFRAPAGDDPGTLNACYNALDVHVIRGRSDDVALSVGGSDLTFARLLTEVAACAGVLRAFGVETGDQVALGAVSRETGVLVVLAAARVGAVVQYDDSPGAEGKVVVRAGGGEVVFAAGGDEIPWDVAMRAGRTDPAGCADVRGDAVLARHGSDELTVLAALGASDVPTPPTPPGATLLEVAGLQIWSFEPPGA